MFFLHLPSSAALDSYTTLLYPLEAFPAAVKKMSATPDLKQFRVEISKADVAHLVFDMPGRTMNVFSNAAIGELGVFARWLRQSAVRGAVLRSGKASAFCAGADLAELGEAYDMIMAQPPEARHGAAFKHFFQLSKAIRELETAGKPVAAAVVGLALGGGCELALGAHYRVAADDLRTAFGLPESLVGLLPGAGGTQRLPRLVGVSASLPILLDGARLAGADAKAVGLADALHPPGDVAAAAEDWVLRQKFPPLRERKTPDEGDGWRTLLARKRRDVMAQTLGHEPAPLAILDCLEQGFEQPLDSALKTEMDIFSRLIQRREPRNMIRTLFVARQERDRAKKGEGLPREAVHAAGQLADLMRGRIARDPDLAPALARGGFKLGVPVESESVASVSEYWFDAAPNTAQKRRVRALLDEMIARARSFRATMTDQHQRIADLILVEEGFPAYLGGPFAMAADQPS